MDHTVNTSAMPGLLPELASPILEHLYASAKGPSDCFVFARASKSCYIATEPFLLRAIDSDRASPACLEALARDPARAKHVRDLVLTYKPPIRLTEDPVRARAEAILLRACLPTVRSLALQRDWTEVWAAFWDTFRRCGARNLCSLDLKWIPRVDGPVPAEAIAAGLPLLRKARLRFLCRPFVGDPFATGGGELLQALESLPGFEELSLDLVDGALISARPGLAAKLGAVWARPDFLHDVALFAEIRMRSLVIDDCDMTMQELLVLRRIRDLVELRIESRDTGGAVDKVWAVPHSVRKLEMVVGRDLSDEDDGIPGPNAVDEGPEAHAAIREALAALPSTMQVRVSLWGTAKAAEEAWRSDPRVEVRLLREHT